MCDNIKDTYLSNITLSKGLWNSETDFIKDYSMLSTLFLAYILVPLITFLHLLFAKEE